MHEYELVFIVHPELEENAFNDIVERVKNWVSEDSGEVTKVDMWGKRHLAYPIRKLNEGRYVYMETKMKPENSAQLDRNLRFLEPVLRHMLIVK